MVAFVRGVAEADVLLKKGLWLRGRWHSVKRYEAVQPIRSKKGWEWVGERLDEVMKNEGSALRLVNMSVKGIHGAVQGLVEEVREMKFGKKEKRVWPGKEVRGWKEAEKKVDEEMRKEEVEFTSRVKKDNGGESWFPTSSAKSSSLLQEVPPIASGTSGSKTIRTFATKEEMFKALGLKDDVEWESEG